MTDADTIDGLLRPVAEQIQRANVLEREVERLNAEADHLRAILQQARDRGDHYQQQLVLVQAERDHSMRQVATFQAQMGAAAEWFENQAAQVREWAAEAIRAPYGSRPAMLPDDEPVPRFLTQEAPN